jgi:ubiquinone/menaquinone biosynthesis C-methylase UbiE
MGLLNNSLISSSNFSMDKEYAEYLLVKTREDYNLIAEDFSRTRDEIWDEMFFLFENYLKPGDEVLDLGCGNGRWFKLFKTYNIDYIGVDSSVKLIDMAQKNNPEAKFQVEEGLNLSFPDNFFDKIYSIAVLHHIPSKEFRLEFLKEAKRILKPGGIIVITVWKLKDQTYLFIKYTILKLLRKSKLDFRDVLEPWGKKLERYYHCFSETELINLIKEAGFKIKEGGIIKNEAGNRQNLYIVAQK